MSNPLTIKKYYIIETPVVDQTNVSTYNFKDGSKMQNDLTQQKMIVYYNDIITEPTPLVKNGTIDPTKIDNSVAVIGGNTYNLSPKYDVYGLSNYISNALVQFINDIQLFNQCNQYASPNKKAIPVNCQDTFQQYDTNDNIKQNMNTLPLYKEAVMSGNRRKHLQQQLNDLNNIIRQFNTIIVSISSDPKLPKDQYNQILTLNNQNVNLRNNLDQKLGEIYEYHNSKIVGSKLYLDSTVYSGVLWSILATSLIYIMFTKM
jgi:hypothetical protein